MGVPQGTRMRVEGGEVRKQTAVGAGSKCRCHGVAHRGGGSQCQMQVC